MLLPSALGSSPHPPVSVYGTGMYHTIAAFLDGSSALFATLSSLPVTGSPYTADFPTAQIPRLDPAPSRARASSPCPHSSDDTWCRNMNLLSIGYAFGLTLGPDLPRADQLYPGFLGYSAWRILTSISLLIPAFSLHDSPRLLPVPLPPVINAPLPMSLTFLSFGVVFQPRSFSAQGLSASELLRTL